MQTREEYLFVTRFEELEKEDIPRYFNLNIVRDRWKTIEPEEQDLFISHFEMDLFDIYGAEVAYTKGDPIKRYESKANLPKFLYLHCSIGNNQRMLPTDEQAEVSQIVARIGSAAPEELYVPQTEDGTNFSLKPSTTSLMYKLDEQKDQSFSFPAGVDRNNLVFYLTDEYGVHILDRIRKDYPPTVENSVTITPGVGAAGTFSMILTRRAFVREVQRPAHPKMGFSGYYKTAITN